MNQVMNWVRAFIALALLVLTPACTSGPERPADAPQGSEPFWVTSVEKDVVYKCRRDAKEKAEADRLAAEKAEADAKSKAEKIEALRGQIKKAEAAVVKAETSLAIWVKKSDATKNRAEEIKAWGKAKAKAEAKLQGLQAELDKIEPAPSAPKEEEAPSAPKEDEAPTSPAPEEPVPGESPK